MSDVFAGPQKPTEAAPVRMPDPEDPNVLEAAKRRRKAALAGGRDATRLSGGDTVSSFSTPSAGAAAPVYTGTTLG